MFDAVATVATGFMAHPGSRLLPLYYRFILFCSFFGQTAGRKSCNRQGTKAGLLPWPIVATFYGVWHSHWPKRTKRSSSA